MKTFRFFNKYEFSLSTTAKRKWYEIGYGRNRHYFSDFYRYFGWWKFGVFYTRPDLEEVEICLDCGSNEIIHESEEGISFCTECRSVENTKRIPFLEWEKEHE